MSCYNMSVIISILLLSTTLLLPTFVSSSIPAGSSAEKLSQSSAGSEYDALTATASQSQPEPSPKDIAEAFQRKQSGALVNGNDEEETQLENSSEYSHVDGSHQNSYRSDDDGSFGSSRSQASSDSDYAADDPSGSRNLYVSKRGGNDNSHLKGDRGTATRFSSTASTFSSFNVGNGDDVGFSYNSSACLKDKVS